MVKKFWSARKSVLVCTLGLVLAVSLILMSAPADARNIKVGIIDCYSGPPAVYGNDALNGFKLALEEINKKGVLGGKIEFTTRDTKFKVDIGLNLAKELVMRENVDVLVEFWDERFTTKQAQESLRARGKRGRRLQERVDAVAAAFILQDYLDALSNNA